MYACFLDEGKYPDDYAGTYINDDGKLVVQLVNPKFERIDDSEARSIVNAFSPTVEARYNAMCANSEAEVYEYVSYSYTELNKLAELVREISMEYIGINGYGIDLVNNRLNVSVDPQYYDEVVGCKELSPFADMIQFRELPGVKEYKVFIGGDGIATSNSGENSLSVGMGGTYTQNGVTYDALLTASHGTVVVGDPIYFNGSRVGTVLQHRYNMEQDLEGTAACGDFAIVALMGNHSSTNKVWRTTYPVGGGQQTAAIDIEGVYYNAPIGLQIFKYGISTQYSWGVITEFYNYRLTGGPFINGLLVSDMNKIDDTYAVDHGDSGGAVYMCEEDGTYKIVATVVGGRALAGTDEHYNFTMISSPVQYAVSAGFVPKTQ